MTADYPIVGRGPNSFVAEGVRYRSPEEANETNFQFADDPHSVFFALAAGAGILGALGYLVVAGWALRRGVALDKDNLLGAAFAAAVTAYLVQSLVSIDEITLRAACWASLGGLAAAAVPALHDGRVKKVAPTRKRRQAKAPPKQPLRLAPLVPLLALIPIAALWYGANFLLADIRVLHGKNLFNNNQIDDAKQTFARVLDFRGDNFIYRQSLGHRLGQAAYEAGAEGSTEDAEALLEDSKKAFSYFDDFPHVLGMVDQARILHALGEVFPEELEASSETYARAMNIDPINPLLRVELARVLRVAGEHERSLAVLEPVVDEVDPTRYPEFWGNLALAEANTQRYVESLDDIERALSLDPKQPEAQAAITVLERNPAAIKALKQFQEQGSEDKAD